MRFSVIIPTYNGGSIWLESAKSISEQSIKPDAVYVIDSSSKDNTVTIAESYDFRVKIIPSSDFNHGGTRNCVVQKLSDSDILIFMTQDAILNSSDAFERLLAYFDDESIAAVCGRQLPHDDANPLATHARLFNYPDVSDVKTLHDIPRLGIKTAFMSNSFSAYRTRVFNELGGFPDNTILSEDMYLAAKMILAGYKIAYSSEACVRHSHNYTPIQEFKRYFDIGVFHADNKFIMQYFGGAGGEGVKYVVSEIKYLLKHAPLLIPKSFCTIGMKFIGFKLGLSYRSLPKFMIRSFSMHERFWDV